MATANTGVGAVIGEAMTHKGEEEGMVVVREEGGCWWRQRDGRVGRWGFGKKQGKREGSVVREYRGVVL